VAKKCCRFGINAKDILGDKPSQAKHAATLAPHCLPEGRGAVQVSGSVNQNERNE
jgi:hypothetical protein